MRARLLFSFIGLAAGAAAPALTINLSAVSGNAPTNTKGEGTLRSVVAAAAGCWEKAILDTFTLELSYGWAAVAGDEIAHHTLLNQRNGREEVGILRFDNDESTEWYMDKTPMDMSEWTTPSTTQRDLGGGEMNVSRKLSGAQGDAAGRYDLFTTALHEIGHALGLATANESFKAETGRDSDIDLTAPRSYPGSSLKIAAGAHLDLPDALLTRRSAEGVRRIMSEADILAVAQVSQFRRLNLNPCPLPVPEPATWAALGLGALTLLRRRYKAERLNL